MIDAVGPFCPACERVGCDGKRCQETAESERAEIVAWLRNEPTLHRWFVDALADAIERMDYKRGGGGQ